jgi:hypothetical protein
MSITSQLFYRKYGVRLLQQIMTPVFFDLNTLDFPLKSIYHYTTFDGIELGPPSDDYLFRNIKKPIMVGHVSDVGAQLGNPRKQAVNTAAFIRDYQNQNRRMRPLRNVVLASKDPTSLIVYNYCFINKIHRYVRSVFTEYYKWYNTFAAVVNNIATVSNESDHNHYLLCAAPKVIPSLQQLNLASNAGMTQALLKVFKDKDAFMLLELWKYLGANRKSSLFDKIPSNKIHLVNFIYQESGKWTVLNLGVLNSFRQGFEGEDKEYVLDSKLKVDALQLQKRLLKMTMTIMEIRTVTANLVEEPVKDEKVIAPLTGLEIKDEDTDAETAEETDEDEDEDEEDVPTVPSELEPVPVETAANEVTNQITDIDDESEPDEEELEKQRIKEEDELLDKDLAYLNEIAKKQENEATESTGTIADIIAEADITLEDGVMNICDRLADDGLLTAGEYRRFKNLSNAYKEIISPDGHTPLSEFIVIKPEDLKMTESATMVDSPSILDKSMLKSSLIDFDSRYIENVLSKDTANMVLNVQKAGIAVTNYKVEKVRDILGGYETHMLKIAPVEGAPSTLKFKLPIVDADGRFESNGIKYFLRKQRGDCPIRKVDYNRVALTSYYGKVFINRAKRKAVDYGHWLQCITMEKGLDKLDHDITDIKPANVFDNSLKSPRSYSSLSMSFKSLMCRGYTVTFDRSEVLKTYPVHVLNTFEKDGNLVIGVNASSSYLIMDKEGAVYTTEGDELKLFGTFENFLNILVGTSPVESVDISVFGKDVPIGIVLAYQIGFEKLMNLLKVTPRRVNAGSRLNLEANEYAVAFSDETLIFSRDDRLASLILAGFNEYHRALKLFSVYSFDKRGVYLNLLDTNKLGVRYLREIDLMYTMFIDPITKDLLVEMKEPTTFQGLLFRSCEMLLDDQHPDELDPAYMRIKGYERLSGAVYTELVQAIRVHGGKLGKSNKPIELNPYAVWKRIAEDPSKGQVSEINPIKALKETEAVTYAGTGGRNKRSMTGHTRSYHVNDMGTISESTTDSSDVAINVFTSADPQFTSLRGMSKRYDFKTTGATALLSTSALLAAGSDRDDPKRVCQIAPSKSNFRINTFLIAGNSHMRQSAAKLI